MIIADSSGSDTDDPDKEKIDSVVFMPVSSLPRFSIFVHRFL